MRTQENSKYRTPIQAPKRLLFQRPVLSTTTYPCLVRALGAGGGAVDKAVGGGWVMSKGDDAVTSHE